MFLKRLSMQGFKSFADKIDMEFGDGITGIVGPNGSGKSNISDALRWVMGEQSAKTLRGGKMEDVIFAGSEKRKPLGFSEVTITLDNTSGVFASEYSEIEVTRRVYRSGESEYLINKSPCRLKDIHELFMDTGLGRDGYSVIGQGKIDEIMSTKAEDRRHIFEEAAGISKYKYRKQEAERKLENTEANLVRARDIMTELEAQVGPLETQSKKARKYLDLREELKKTEVNLSIVQIEKIRADEDKNSENFANLTMELESAQLAYNNLLLSEQQLFEKIRQREGDIEQQRSGLHSSEMVFERTQSEIALLQKDIENAKANIAELLAEAESFEKTAQKTVEDSALQDTETEKINKDIAELEHKISLLFEESEKMQEKINAKNGEVFNLQRNVDEAMREILNVAHKKENAEKFAENFAERAEALEKSIAEAEGRKKALADEKANIEKEIKENKELFEKTNKELLEKEQKIALARQKVSEKKNQYNTLSSQQSAKAARLSALKEMERSMEGFAPGVRAVMQAGELAGRVRGVLSSLISVEDKYLTAVEVALGGSLQNIVTKTEQDAAFAIEYLKREKKGRATFLPMNAVSGRRLEEEGKLKGKAGYLGLACDFVSCESEYDNIILNLLGKTVLCDNSQNAIAIAKQFSHRIKVVTLEGELLMPGGAMQGGSRSIKQQILGRSKEIAALEEELLKTEKLLDKTEDEIDNLEEEGIALAKNIENLRQSMQGYAQKNTELLGKTETNAHLEQREDDELKNLKEQKQLIYSASEGYDDQKLMLEKEEQKAKENHTGAQENLEKEREALKKLLEEKENMGKEATNIRMQVNDRHRDAELCLMQKENALREAEKMNLMAKAKREEIVRQENSIKAILLRIDLKNKDTEENEKLSKELRESIEKMTREKEEENAQLDKVREDVKSKNERVLHLSEEHTRFEAKIARTREELERIISNLWDSYELTYSSALELKSDIGDIKEAKIKVSDLKGQMKRLGNINLDSIEEYKRVFERYTELSGSIADLEGAKAELLKIIAEMTKIMTKTFEEQFTVINKAFGEVFTKLFGGGTAKVSLSDPKNVLESGIEIEVQPPGKKLQRLQLLSGGEKALSAAALLFAVFKVRPAPFCILDEIEAALDDNNILRFAEYLKSCTDKTQFIVITHRRGTMEAADILYGITMQEKGVSKMLAMHLN